MTVTSELNIESFKLGSWEVFPRENRIQSGSNVQILQPLIMDLLVYLCRFPNTVCTKKEILFSVWGTDILSRNVLPNAIQKLRETLCLENYETEIIETIRGRGYRILISPHPSLTKQSLTNNRHFLTSFHMGILVLIILTLAIWFKYNSPSTVINGQELDGKWEVEESPKNPPDRD